ncbi:GIY-YIG nuclease family protein [Natrialba sp. INN-245]|uniref:GIY-YIG nuclease family protein n=1 Tax=Natrialba sp. INN-245 TaxID=2690967 RepID=UPI001311ADF4|nr:GIY-YIG nuclease family protein [Natrialba sp. INN-245]MWV38837.1 GIY-YIG nuclease family protein [Natrialba sp. INN-245]
MNKAALWDSWLEETLLHDLHSSEEPDPVPLFETTDHGLETSSALGSYKWGKNDGEYLYLIYLLDEPVTDAQSVVPVYVGESSNISSRIGQHSRKIRDALPITAWEDNDQWGGFSKYDQIAAVEERTDDPLYVWIIDVDDLECGPYGYETYRQELEAKLVGLVHAQSLFERIFANREFVPNRILHEIGKAGPEWVAEEITPRSAQSGTHKPNTEDGLPTKAECWRAWTEEYILADIQSNTRSDPIPLFEVTDDLRVRTDNNGVLQRSAEIDARIRREGQQCVNSDGIHEDGCDGLLYVMYQLKEPASAATPSDIVPRYIGKAEAYGKKRELSSNFTEIAYERNATRSFARWGDGNYWHVGELSMALAAEDERKRHWKKALFEPGSQTLSQRTYLWVHAWNSEEDTSPYQTPATLAEVEALLIGTAYDAYPNHLLNKSGTPDDAPIKLETPTSAD